MTDQLARIDHLRIRRPRFTLDDVSLAIPRGAVVGLVGPNGAGKTTLIRAMLGLVHADGGTIEVAGHPAGAPAGLQRTGVVLDRPTAAPEWRVATVGRRLAPFHPAWDESVLAATLDRLSVPTHGRVGDLSRGQGVKLAMAIALAQQPELLILDEPSSGLDSASRRQLLDLIREVMVDDRRAVLLSTHITTELDDLADHLVVLADGRVAHEGAMPDAAEAFALARGTGAAPDAVIGVDRTGSGWSGLVRIDESAALGADVVLDPATIDDLVIHLAGATREVAA